MSRKKGRRKKDQLAQKLKEALARQAPPVEQEAPTSPVEAPAAASAAAAPSPAAEPVLVEPVLPAAEPPAPPPPSAPLVPPVTEAGADAVEDLDADLDEEDVSYESLVALVAGMPDDDPQPTPAATATRRRADDAPVEDVIEVLDLDADEDTEAVDRLIARAVVGAPVVEEEPEPEAPLIDLDADEPIASPVRAAAGTARPANSAAERLAAAVARGAIDEADNPAIPIDLGEVSTPEARARLLAEALAHAAHKEARYRVPMDTGTARRWKGLVALGIFILAAWVAVVPPGWVRPEPPAQLNQAARARSIRTALLLQAQQVEAFRVRTQRLPSGLDELPETLPGIRYARAGNRTYQLIGYEPDGNAIVYDSANPSDGFRALMAAWPPAEATP